MRKPRIKELLIEPDVSPLLSHTVRIEAHTEAAMKWVHENVRQFGHFYQSSLGDGNIWALYVYHAYERAEVIDYLNALWESERETSEAWQDEIEIEDRFKPGGFWYSDKSE